MHILCFNISTICSQLIKVVDCCLFSSILKWSLDWKLLHLFHYAEFFSQNSDTITMV